MKKQSLQLQHIDFFYEKGSVIFYNLLSESKLKQAKQALCFIQASSQRNCWKQNDSLKKLSFSHDLSLVAAQLVRLKNLRFGFDHYFSSFQEVKNFFKPDLSLSQLSSIDGLEIALLLNLSSENTPSEDPVSTFPFFSASGCFFNPNIPLESLSSIETAQGPFFLITYCKSNARHIYQPLDPFTHETKKEGQGFGDLVSNEFHPLLRY